MEKEIETSRVKLSINLNAKGLVQWDITSEFPSLEDSAKNLDSAIKEMKKIIAENGYKEAGV